MLNMKKRRDQAPFFIQKFSPFLRDCVAILVCHCGEPKPRAKRVGGTTVRVAIFILSKTYEIAYFLKNTG